MCRRRRFGGPRAAEPGEEVRRRRRARHLVRYCRRGGPSAGRSRLPAARRYPSDPHVRRSSCAPRWVARGVLHGRRHPGRPVDARRLRRSTCRVVRQIERSSGGSSAGGMGAAGGDALVGRESDFVVGDAGRDHPRALLARRRTGSSSMAAGRRGRSSVTEVAVHGVAGCDTPMPRSVVGRSASTPDRNRCEADPRCRRHRK